MRTIQQSERAFPARMNSPRRGSVLVEFALVSFIMYLLLVVLLDLGRGSLATQTIQSAATVLAQELSRAPLDATLTFEEALADPYVTSRIYDEKHLVVEIDKTMNQADVDALFATLPLVNQMLGPLMIRQPHPSDPDNKEIFLYPGALLTKDGEFTVLVPRVLDRGVKGVETIDWIHVVEEVLPAADDPSHFPINSPSPFAGVVNIRVNYPYQAAAMSAFDPDAYPSGPASVIAANDSGVTDTGLPDGYDYVYSLDPGLSAPYAGKYGLGYHYAFLQKVRPYRKVIYVQAVARREVIFGPEEP